MIAKEQHKLEVLKRRQEREIQQVWALHKHCMQPDHHDL